MAFTDTMTAGSATHIASRARFETIRYAQVWEDADILVSALRPKSGDTIVSIASAGDNALALLATACERVIAVDLNPAQLACVRFRIEAYRKLTHGEYLELMGSHRSGRRRHLLEEVASDLSSEDQVFWAAIKDVVVEHGAGGVGKFERYVRTFREWVLPFIHNRDTIDELLRHRDADERGPFYERHWNIWGWRMMLKVFFSRTVMGRLGRDPAFFDQVECSPAELAARLTRKMLVDQDPSNNPYLHWILRGFHGDVLPYALEEERFETIRERLDRLDVRLCTVETLADEGVKADCFNLSDIFECMSPEAHEAAYGSILATANPEARIAYWNMMAPRRAPAKHAGKVRTNRKLEADLKPLDRAFFYSDFVIEEVL
jgi:S-adenosylmethionine-diacylglycerol 3-amino-3-carboxypropyl transferase